MDRNTYSEDGYREMASSDGTTKRVQHIRSLNN